MSKDQLNSVPIFAEAQKKINAGSITDKTIERTRTAKAIIDILVSDCIATSGESIAKANIKTLDDIYANQNNFIALSQNSEKALRELERFLFDNFYMHESVMQTTIQVKGWLSELFDSICGDTNLMPGYYQKFIETETKERAVCDYIAGMTDCFCLKTLEKN